MSLPPADKVSGFVLQEMLYERSHARKAGYIIFHLSLAFKGKPFSSLVFLQFIYEIFYADRLDDTAHTLKMTTLHNKILEKSTLWAQTEPTKCTDH